MRRAVNERLFGHLTPRINRLPLCVPCVILLNAGAAVEDALALATEHVEQQAIHFHRWLFSLFVK